MVRPGVGQARHVHHMGMGQHGRRTVPAVADALGGARGERDEPVGRGDHDVERGFVGGRVLLMGIAEVVHGVDQGLAVPSEGVDERGQLGRALRVEAEMQVVHVEVVVVGTHPVRVQHDRRPPALRRTGRAVRPGVREAGDVVGRRRGAVPHVHVAGGYRGDPDPSRTSCGLRRVFGHVCSFDSGSGAGAATCGRHLLSRLQSVGHTRNSRVRRSARRSPAVRGLRRPCRAARRAPYRAIRRRRRGAGG